MIAMDPLTTRKQMLPAFTGFCVYAHRRATDGQTFYIGLGRRARVRAKTSRNASWTETATQHGYTCEVLETFDTAEQAAQREIELIREYREAGAPLVNRSEGGEGVARWVTKAPDPLREYKAIQARAKLHKAIDQWQEAKLNEYWQWLATYKAGREVVQRARDAAQRAADAADAMLHEHRYRASLR